MRQATRLGIGEDMKLIFSPLVLALLALSACSKSGTATVDQQRLEQAGTEPQNWMTHGGTFNEDRYSALSDINSRNVSQLKLAWSSELSADHGAEATPIVVDGVMYVTSAWSIVHAFDAATGKKLWVYDPKVPHASLAHSCCGPANRGVAVWKGKVYVATFDGRLIALNAENGLVEWETLTVDQSKPYTITGAPRAAQGLIFIGNGGAELGVRGYVSAYDAESGALRWRFYVTPNPKGPDNAVSDSERTRMLATWNPKAGEWLKLGGGGTAWDALVFDQDTDTLWIGTGNGSPWNLEIRSPSIPGRNNDNLFLASIVAVDAKTGRYRCHYQQNPELNYDYTATQPIILGTLKINGKDRKVLMQAPKNGNFYVIDRTDCSLISVAAFAKQTWTDGVDMKTGRPRLLLPSNRPGKPQLVIPGGFGAHTWHPMAMSHQTGLVYIPTQDIPETMIEDKKLDYRKGRFNTGYIEPILADTPTDIKDFRDAISGHLVAWDPVKQKAAWRIKLPGAVNGGTLATAGGLVFQGTLEGNFRAYDAKSGQLLWSVDNGGATFAGPVTYKVGDVQYVATLAGDGTPIYLAGGFVLPRVGTRANAKVNVYSLKGTAKLAIKRQAPLPFPQPPKMSGNAAQLARGANVYSQNCIFCHGIGAVTGGVITDLRRSPVLQSRDAWAATVHGGRLDDGMPDFSGWISDADAEAVRAYVASKALLAFDAERNDTKMVKNHNQR